MYNNNYQHTLENEPCTYSTKKTKERSKIMDTRMRQIITAY